MTVTESRDSTRADPRGNWKWRGGESSTPPRLEARAGPGDSGAAKFHHRRPALLRLRSMCGRGTRCLANPASPWFRETSASATTRSHPTRPGSSLMSSVQAGHTRPVGVALSRHRQALLDMGNHRIRDDTAQHGFPLGASGLRKVAGHRIRDLPPQLVETGTDPVPTRGARGMLRERSRPYGNFLGCSNYPELHAGRAVREGAQLQVDGCRTATR